MFTSIRSWHLAIGLLIVASFAPCAYADIVSIDTAKKCSGPSDPACNNGAAFSLQSVENGTTTLSSFYPGTTTQGFYLLQNDSSSVVTSFTFTLSGPALPSNHFLTCQVNGAFGGDSCSMTGSLGTVGTGAKYGPSGLLLPVTFTFSGFSLASGQQLEFTFASFGQNDTTSTTVPEPPALILLLVSAAAVMLGGVYIRSRSPRSV
jgi:hypothetical protein